MSGLVLITTLNARNPIPNAASIFYHEPDILVLIRQPHLNEYVKDSLELSSQRLKHWCESSLENMYGFENELEFGPQYPTSEPNIKIIDFESDSQIESEILSLSEEVGNHVGTAPEIRCECNSGRKEDSAKMVDLARALGGSCWYTDVDSGISAGIGVMGDESRVRQLSPFSRFWLSGFPCIDGYEISEIKEREMLGVVLDCFANCLNYGDIPNDRALARKKVEDSLRDEGIEVVADSEDGRFRFVDTEGGAKSDFSLSEGVFSIRSGEMVEELASLSLVESLGSGARVISGLRWTNDSSFKRRQGMRTTLLHFDNQWANYARRSLFEHHQKNGSLPSGFEEFGTRGKKSPSSGHEPSELENHVRNWFESFDDDFVRWREFGDIVKKSWDKITVDEKKVREWFVKWALHKDRWHNYPPQLREQMEKVATRRELDILVFDPSLGTLFIECKTSPDQQIKLAGKVQQGSLIGVLGSHRNAIKIQVHSAVGRRRGEEDGSFTVGWDSLRDIRDLLSDAK